MGAGLRLSRVLGFRDFEVLLFKDQRLRGSRV